jgi:RecA-family ATPase
MSVAPSLTGSAATRRKKKIELIARYKEATKGGELHRWIDKITPVGRTFDVKKLEKAGYRLTATYNYTSPEGHLLYQSLCYRHRHVKAKKHFVLRHEDPDVPDEWLFGSNDLKVLYRWQALCAAPDAVVYFCEGEKDAERLAALGLVACTVAGQNWSQEAAEALRGRHVCILEDNDKEGRANAVASAEALRFFARSIRIVSLPDLPHKGDVSDWLDAGHTKEELIAICEATPADGVKLFNIWELDDVDIPIQRWSVPDRIPCGYTTLFSGEGAAGKNLIQLQQCVATALGFNWLGVSPRQGRAVFFDAEDDTTVIHRRLYDILQHYGCRFADLKDKLYISSMIGQDAVLATSNRAGKIETTAFYDKILEMVGDIKPMTITVASSANVFAGNEIDRSQVQQFVAYLTRLAMIAGGSLVLISHPSLSGIMSNSGLSGSTQWHNAVRARYYIKGLKDEDGEPGGSRRIIQFMKNNYGPISEEIVVEYRNSLFVPANTTVDEAARAEHADEVYLSILKTLTEQNQGPFSAAKNSSAYAATVISQHPSCRPFQKKDMEAAQQRLLDRNQIHVEDHGSPSRPAKHIVLGPRRTDQVDAM